MNENDLLIDAPTLKTLVDDENYVIIDCRAALGDPAWGLKQYHEGHIKNARFASLNKDLAGKPGVNGRHPLPERSTFADRLSRWGVEFNTNVVAYDAHQGMYACRFWWMLRWMGHGKVRVLDGGLQSWLENGFGLSTEQPSVKIRDFSPSEPLNKFVSADDILINSYTLVDARDEERFKGIAEPIDHQAGHIPGAVCKPFRNNLNDNGCFRNNPNYFDDLDTKKPIVCYCGSGVSATHNVMAMILAGYPEPALYPGSWSEWIEDPTRPISKE